MQLKFKVGDIVYSDAVQDFYLIKKIARAIRDDDYLIDCFRLKESKKTTHSYFFMLHFMKVEVCGNMNGEIIELLYGT